MSGIFGDSLATEHQVREELRQVNGDKRALMERYSARLKQLGPMGDRPMNPNDEYHLLVHKIRVLNTIRPF